MERLLAEMEQYASDFHVPIIRAEERELFLQIVREACPHHVLEIGTAIGYSTLLLAQNGAPGVRITTLEFNETRAALARGFIARSPYADRITVLTGDAGRLLPSLSGFFDFVFLDAAKGQYPDYFHKMQRILTENAVIAADNVLFRGYVQGKERPPRRFRTMVKRLQEYIRLVSSSPGFVTKIYGDGDGLAVTRRIAGNEEKA